MSFSPEAGGQFEDKLILACDNDTHETYTLKGKGCMLDPQLTEIDDKKVLEGSQVEEITFDVTEPKTTSTRKIKIKNNSPLPLHYHFSLYKTKVPTKISLVA